MTTTERKGDNQKLKMLYLVKIFMEETDDNHSLSIHEIIKKLEAYGVNANRKTLYKDFEELRNYGLDIITNKDGRNFSYCLGCRDFELAELKLLVDSVQSAKFITDKKSKDLIKKLESLVSKYDGRLLQRQVVMAGRIKTVNESVYYTVDRIHDAINSGKQVSFKYFQWNVNKEMDLRHDGAWYKISPWALMWDDEYYYLVAFDSQSGQIKHYRVDKMLQISVVDQRREGYEEFKQFDMARYAKSLFGMFGGKEAKVTLEADNSMVGIFIDRFGKDILIIPTDANHFQAVVNVSVSNQFLGWVMALGDSVRIVNPPAVVEDMRSLLARIAKLYED